MIITLCGYMGSGKSTVGKSLANQLNYNFLDLDSLIEKECEMKVSEIFKKKGEIFFRKKENSILNSVLQREKDVVLAVGGGTPVYYNNMELINQKSYSIYLAATISVLTERLWIEKTNRPLISHLNKDELPEFIAKHLFERNVFYEKAKYKIAIQTKSKTEIVSEIMFHLQYQNLS